MYSLRYIITLITLILQLRYINLKRSRYSRKQCLFNIFLLLLLFKKKSYILGVKLADQSLLQILYSSNHLRHFVHVPTAILCVPATTTPRWINKQQFQRMRKYLRTYVLHACVYIKCYNFKLHKSIFYKKTIILDSYYVVTQLFIDIILKIQEQET